VRLTPVFTAAALVASPAAAQEVKPLLDLRLRWEQVDEDGAAKDADAATLRARTGAELKLGDWRLLGETESTFAPVERYFSSVNGQGQFPLVGDPENFELNRLQLQYRGLRKTVVTLGRQRINIEDQRFVGASGWRQNEQTFDAARIEYGDPKGLQTDLTFAWSVRTIWGIDGAGARQQAIGGDNVFMTLSNPTPIGKLSGFAFLVDQDEAAVQGFRLSSKTYGVRLAGSRALSKTARVSYALGYARQSDWHRNPNEYSADYYLIDLALELQALNLGLGYEVLGADEGVALTSFQTPLATLHKFQGWADKFTTTPPDGVHDLYGSAAYGWKRIAGFDSFAAVVVHHRFRSDQLGRRYGSEWDAQLVGKRGAWTVTAKVADYDADEFATDTRKLWLQLEWSQ
jgi:hypothetical protein